MTLVKQMRKCLGKPNISAMGRLGMISYWASAAVDQHDAPFYEIGLVWRAFPCENYAMKGAKRVGQILEIYRQNTERPE